MKRKVNFLQKPIVGVSILMCSVALLSLQAHAEPLVINPFPTQEKPAAAAPAAPPAIDQAPPALGTPVAPEPVKEEPIKEEAAVKEEPVPAPAQAELENPAVLGTPEAISARPERDVQPPEPYEFEASEPEEASAPVKAAEVPKSEPAVIEDAPSPIAVSEPAPVAAPAPIQAASRELPPGVKIPEPGSSYFDAPAGATPVAAEPVPAPIAEAPPAAPQPRYITEAPAKEQAPVAAANYQQTPAPLPMSAEIPGNKVTIESAGKAQDVNDAYEGGGIVVKSASGRASDLEIRKLAEQNQMPQEELRPLESAPPPPQRVRMSDQLQEKANALVDENPMPRAADVAPVASSEPLSVSLQDIGEKAVDPAEPIAQQDDGGYVPFMAQRERGYVPQDADIQKEFEEIAPLPVLKDEPRDVRQIAAEQTAEIVEAPVEQVADVAPVQAMPVSAPIAEPQMPKPGLVYIRDGEVLDNNTPISAAPVPTQEVASIAQPEEITWASARPEAAAAMKAATMDGAWNADEGASVRDVLSSWSSRAGVRLIWENSRQFEVREPVDQGGAYEAAVQALLDQYADDGVRPLATLHLDPQSGERALVIR